MRLAPRKAGFSLQPGKSLRLRERVVADVVLIERVSTLKFPANREKNREFREIRLLCKILKPDTRTNSKAFSQIPYKIEEGFISAEQGVLSREQGIWPAKSQIVAG